MKYLAIIIQARNNANNTGLSQEEVRRQVTLLHLKFYGALMLSIVLIWYLGSNRPLCVLLLYSFWVPQIILNIVTESRKPMHPYYLYGMSITRSVAPIYVFAIRDNFLKEVNPDFPTDLASCQMLVLWCVRASCACAFLRILDSNCTQSSKGLQFKLRSSGLKASMAHDS